MLLPLCRIRPRLPPEPSWRQVGVPGVVYETVRTLRQARSRRLGAIQRKSPQGCLEHFGSFEGDLETFRVIWECFDVF